MDHATIPYFAAGSHSLATASAPVSRRSTLHLLVDRDGGWCHYCANPLFVEGHPLADCNCWPSASIDHVRPRIDGGSDDLANLVLACVSCNSSKGAKPYDIFVCEMREVLGLRRWDGKPYGVAA